MLAKSSDTWGIQDQRILRLMRVSPASLAGICGWMKMRFSFISVCVVVIVIIMA